MSSELIDGLQIDATQHTGVCIFAVNKNGQNINQWPEVTFYGASDELDIPKKIGAGGDIFITNINTYRRLVPKGQLFDVLEEVNKLGKIFAFRFSGIQHGTDEKLDQKELFHLLANLPKSPDIIFANATEMQHASGIDDINLATQLAFAESRLVVVTNGGKGSLIRFNGRVFEVPAREIEQGNVIDTTGAGDSYMGSMLAALLTRRYYNWSIEFVLACAEIGTVAASEIIQSLDSRLTSHKLVDLSERIKMIPRLIGPDVSRETNYP